MKAAIENFAALKAESKMLFLGGMMELGEGSIQEHREIIQLIQNYNWKEVVLVGGDYKNVQHSFQYFSNVSEAKDWFQKQNFQNSYMLVKGSRSMQMEKLLDR
jgi:UDP-N-acetylmuramoyl-tripeptide--D-alanyl-D-alanine ligase